MKVKPVEPLTLAPAVSTQLPSRTSPSDGLASPQHPSVLLQEKAEPWKGPGEVERLYGARADFAGTLHAQHKKAADILLQLKGVLLSTSSAWKIINYSAHKGSSRKG